MRTKIVAALAVVAAVGLVSSATAQEDTLEEAGTVTVDVNNVTAVDLSPNNLAYSGDPGSVATTETTNGYQGVEIENVGSENITELYFTTSTPDSRPFGSGTAGAYDAGNFIQIKPSTEITGINGEDDFQYVSRKSFNESNTLSYVKPITGQGSVRYGRFRAANESFFWMITEAEAGGSSGNYCSGGTGSNLLIGNTPHTPTQTGSVDFTDDTTYTNYSIGTSSDNYGRVDNVGLNTYEGTKNLTMLTWCGDSTQQSADNTTHVIGTRWNPENREDSASNQYSTQTNSLEKLIDDPQDPDELQPGEHFTVFTRAAIPNAVANGQVGSGTLTVKVGVTHDSG
ncbi:hypothetical protein [Candidatus Nanohalococcus occultus]|uniref:Uncharacterized protein n=1 Tax=Candidatus Nanohalococcus occultus TaxID=2978047 RepID=A0ABY8CDH8_9ARCH|nr:hypothetical protein SVXNc_0246 [Candidatus Nanohaloarchaeota archaeon SVXNc]